MKYYLILVFVILSSIWAQAQQTMVGLKLSFGGTLTSVKDKDGSPSGSNLGMATGPGDGLTTLEKNGPSVGLAFSLDLPINDRIYFATGMNFYSKAFTLRNVDGNYSGNSSFGITYFQIPITAKIYFKDINENLKLYGKFGPTLDLKLKEKLKGDGDGAHFWNMAKNDYNNDPYRGRNGDNESKALFAPINFGLLFGFGAEYKLTENIVANAGINYNPSFVNTINPGLKINDAPKTRVGELLKVRTSVLVLEVGIALLF